MLHNLRKSYKLYRDKGNKAVNCKDYLKIVNSLMKYIFEKTLEGYEVKLFNRTGSLKIVGKKEKPKLDENGEIIGLAPDWVKTKKLWETDPKAKEERQRVYHFNEHTNGIRYRMAWSRKGILAKYKEYYSFKLMRANKRAINKKALDGKEYIVVP